MKYVLALSVGPVGSFIAAGRRSRDLWYGSTWLSETTRKVAVLLRDAQGVELLLPTAKRLQFVEEGGQDLDHDRGRRISNKVLALVDVAGGDPRAAHDAASSRSRA